MVKLYNEKINLNKFLMLQISTRQDNREKRRKHVSKNQVPRDELSGLYG